MTVPDVERSAAWAREPATFIEQNLQVRPYCPCGWIGELEPGTWGASRAWEQHVRGCDIGLAAVADRHKTAIAEADRDIARLQIASAQHREQLEQLGLVDVPMPL